MLSAFMLLLSALDNVDIQRISGDLINQIFL